MDSLDVLRSETPATGGKMSNLRTDLEKLVKHWKWRYEVIETPGIQNCLNRCIMDANALLAKYAEPDEPGVHEDDPRGHS